MERIIPSNDWFTISLIVFLLTLVVLKQSNKGKYARLVNFNYIDYYWFNNNFERHFISYFELLTYAFSHIIFSQFLYVLIGGRLAILDFELYNFELFTVLFLSTLLFSILKFNIERFVNYCMNKTSKVSFYIYYKQIIWVYGLLLGLPFLILDFYTSTTAVPFIYGFMIIGASFSAFRLFLFVYKNRSYILKHWYYIILYLCTLEIAPYFFIYKVFSNR